jgi:hypothetical protein
VNDADDDLRDAFAALRQSDRTGIPSVGRLLQERRPRRRMIALRFAAVAMLLIIVVAAALLHRKEEPPADATALLQWRAPTDVLLKTPGSELLDSVPSLRYSLPGPTPDKRTSS